MPGSPPAAVATVLPEEGFRLLLRWAVAAVLPLLLLVFALLSLHLSSPRPVHPAAEISDDALLEQVDQQVSVAVPSSMESLTHLVTTESAEQIAAALREGANILSRRTSIRKVGRPVAFAGRPAVDCLGIGCRNRRSRAAHRRKTGRRTTGPPPMEGRRPPMERAFHLGPHGRWWNNPELAQKLGLTAGPAKENGSGIRAKPPHLDGS